MTSSHELAGLMETNVSDVFGQRDSARRQVAISEIYTEDPAFFDEEGQVAGRDAINARVENLLQQSPGFVFRIVDPAKAIHDVGRLRWQFGPPDAPPVVMGMDVAVFAQGKIRALYTFIEDPDKGS